MLFNSFEFLFFFPLVLVGYYLLPHKFRWAFLLLSSYYFYASSIPSLLILLLISTVVDYICGLKMYNSLTQKSKKKFLLLSILVNLGLLFSFKYLAFFTTTIDDILHFFGLEGVRSINVNSYSFNQILLPVGISFYTFQTMSYSIDVYRGKLIPEKHFGKFALFVAFFPQLVAGPIERAGKLLPQFNKTIHLNIDNIRKGLVLMAWGFFLKVVVADRLGIYVDMAFADPGKNSGLPLVVGATFFAFQIYYDFAAYTSIAIGAAKTMGYDLMQNFNRPFFSTSSSEFWKRWHISLMKWMRHYLYEPLVRKLKFSRLTAVLVVFFINGLWHGASWTFVIWSMLNAFLLIIEVATAKERMKIIKKLGISKRASSVLGWLMITGYLVLSLVFFRASSLTHALYYLKSMLHVNTLNINIISNPLELGLSIFFILTVQLIHYYKGNDKVFELVLDRSTSVRWVMYTTYIFVIVLFAINRQNTFIYFQF